MTRLSWFVALVLALAVTGQAFIVLQGPPGHAVLPIFVPVSLEYERQLRQQTGQPIGRSGRQAAELAEALLAEPLDAATAADLEPRLQQLRATRDRLLALRDRRHALNVRLMHVGVDLGQELTAEQWNHVQSHRDALQQQAEAEVFDRLLDKL